MFQARYVSHEVIFGVFESNYVDRREAFTSSDEVVRYFSPQAWKFMHIHLRRLYRI